MPICKTPRCDNPQQGGRRFCIPCSERLDKIRDALENDPNSTYNLRSDVRKETKGICVYEGCWEDRIPPSKYCTEHEDQEVDDA